MFELERLRMDPCGSCGVGPLPRRARVLTHAEGAQSGRNMGYEPRAHRPQPGRGACLMWTYARQLSRGGHGLHLCVIEARRQCCSQSRFHAVSCAYHAPRLLPWAGRADLHGCRPSRGPYAHVVKVAPPTIYFRPSLSRFNQVERP